MQNTSHAVMAQRTESLNSPVGRRRRDKPRLLTYWSSERDKDTEGKKHYSSPVPNPGWGKFLAYLVDGAPAPNTVNSSVARTRELAVLQLRPAIPRRRLSSLGEVLEK
jgi:hypothetical protein